MVYRFQSANIFLDILSNFHFEKPKPFGVPATSKVQGLIQIADGNSDVGFSIPDIGRSPELPERDAERPSMGVEQGRFQAATSGRKAGSLFAKLVSDGLVVTGGLSDQKGT